MGISIWQLLILLAVVILIFGTKKLKNVGGDLGSAIKSFKTAVKDSGEEDAQANDNQNRVDQGSDKAAASSTAKKEENV